MAALMRLSRGVNLTHLRRFICNSTQQNVLRPLPQSPVTTQKYNITRTPWFITRHLTSATSISESLLMERKQDDQTENITTDRKQTSSRWEPIEEKFNHLDSLIRRSSCLNEQYVFSILNTAEKRVGSLTYQQAVSLIRSTGALLYKEDPASRRAIFADVWKRVEKLVDKLDIVHHNVALKIRLENEEQLDPSKEIENLESLGIEPNRVTFQIMIEAYCLQGNLSGAMTILKHMKENGLHVNENVFHSLMIGKVKNGDFEGAKEVLANMSEAGLLPMAQSYLPLLNGYAEKGDFQGINQTLSELESEDIRCQSRHFFDIIVTLAEHGHGDIIPKVLQEAQERLGHRSPFNQEALNCSYKLTALGKDDDALKIFLGIVDLPDESYKQRIATYFLEAMAQNNRPIEVVSSVAATLKNAGYLTSVPWQNIADTAAKKGHIDSAIDFYKKVVEVGDEVDRRPLSFVFSSKLNQGDYDGLFKVVGEISKLLAHSRLLAYDIYMSAVLELLKSMPEEDIFAKFKENGVTQTHIEEMRFLGYVDAGKFDEAVNARNSIPSFGLVPHFLSRGFMVNRDTDGLTKLFKIMKLKIINQSYLASLATNTLSRIIKRKQLTLEESRDLVKAFIKNRLMVNISSSDTDSVIQILLDKGFSIEETNSIKDSFHDVEVTQSSRQLSSAQIAALSEQLEKDPESVSETTRNRVEMSLLKQYCRNGDVDKVEELKQRLEDRGFLFRNSSLYDLAIFYAKHRKDLEMAVTYKERMLTDQLKISPLLNLSIAILHVEQGNIDAAIKELENVEKRDSRLAFEQVKTSENLLKACADTATPSATRQMLGTLLDLGYLPYATNGALKTVLNTYLTNSADQDEIVSMIEEIVTKHKKVSGFRSVLLHFIEKEDASRLQKVVDILSTVKDESEILHHLALLFIESGKLRQAARILETPGLRAQMKVLQEGCDYLVNTGKEQSLERLVDLTKELANINRDEMLFSLIRFYARRNDSLKKALDVLTRYEEEGIRPSGRTLRYLAKALKQNDMDVPFDVPEFVQPIPKRAVKEESPHDVGYTGINKDIIDALSTGNITVALDLRKSSEGVKADILAEGVKLLRKLKKGEVIRDLLTTLGDQGDVDTLQHLRFNVIRNQENLLHRQLFRAYVNSERTEEFLDFVNGNLGTLYKYMDVPNIRLLVEKKPHLFDKFEALVHSFQAANDKFYCANVLFNYFLLGRQEQKAQELFEKYPDMKATLHVPFLCSQAVENQNENVLQTVEKAIDGVDKWQNILKSSKIQYKCKTGDLQGATDLFEQCEKDGMMLQNFGIKTLEAFSELLTSNNQPIPWKTEELDAMKEEIRQRAATRSSRRNSPRQQTNENDDINSPEK